MNNRGPLFNFEGSIIGKSQNDMSHQYQRCNPKNVDLSINVSITFNTKSSVLVTLSSLHSFSAPWKEEDLCDPLWLALDKGTKGEKGNNEERVS